ncbi:hypothetical protein BDV06DRAFT_209403 [Aspergillus oleicola]
MPITRMINVVGAHCAGEVCEVITGGVLDLPNCTNMYAKLVHFRDKSDSIRQLDQQYAGFLIMESEEYPPVSGGNTIAVATVLLETGVVAMKKPVTEVTLDSPRDCSRFGEMKVDIAWGGMIYNKNGPGFIEVGERIKRAVQEVYTPVHPENPDIQGVSILEFTEPMQEGFDGEKSAVNTVVVSPGRLDRCPCGTGSCARMAVLHAGGQLGVGETFQHHSIIGSTFDCHIRGTTRVREYEAVLPTVKVSAWITGYKQMVLDSTDPFPLGFRVGDQWHVGS